MVVQFIGGNYRNEFSGSPLYFALGFIKGQATWTQHFLEND